MRTNSWAAEQIYDARLRARRGQLRGPLGGTSGVNWPLVLAATVGLAAVGALIYWSSEGRPEVA
jgi:hypothetical protein